MSNETEAPVPDSELQYSADVEIDDELEALLYNDVDLSRVPDEELEQKVPDKLSDLSYLDYISIDDIIKDDDWNCRALIIPMNIRTLADSIAQNGLIQPIVCAPLPEGKYNLVAGFRRYHAYLLLRREDRLLDDKIKVVVDPSLNDPVRAVLHNLSENLQRKDLNMLEEAMSIKRLRDSEKSREEIAAAIGMSTGWVQERLMLLDLPVEIQYEAALGWITSPVLRQLYTIYRKHGKNKVYEAVKKAKIARQRGERVKLVEKKGNILRKKKRSTTEIRKMKNKIYDALGPSYFTVALAWAAGDISDYECFLHIREMAAKNNQNFELPNIDNYNEDTFGVFEDDPDLIRVD